MIMALNAADIGNPICEQAAAICAEIAEIAEQYCAQLHVTTTAHLRGQIGHFIGSDEQWRRNSALFLVGCGYRQ